MKTNRARIDHEYVIDKLAIERREISRKFFRCEMIVFHWRTALKQLIICVMQKAWEASRVDI